MSKGFFEDCTRFVQYFDQDHLLDERGEWWICMVQEEGLRFIPVEHIGDQDRPGIYDLGLQLIDRVGEGARWQFPDHEEGDCELEVIDGKWGYKIPEFDEEGGS